MRKSVIFVALLATLVLAACGGDDDGSGASETSGELVSQPEPASPIEDQMQALNEAIAEDDCEQFAALTFTFLRAPGPDGEQPEFGAPGTSEECEFTEPLRRDIAGLELTEAEEYGTVALAEGELAKPIGGYESALAIWMLDWDGQYRHISVGPSDPVIGTEPEEGADFDAAMDGFIEAVETGDCGSADEIFHEGALFAEPGSSPTEQCEGLVGGKIFAPAFKATEEPEIEQLGATRDLVWYGVATEEAYFTVGLSTPFADQQGSLSAEEQAEFRVIDVLANTEVELPPAPEEEAEPAPTEDEES